MVEIEVFSHCNRRCWFCPNSFIDRKSKNIHMPEKYYLKVLKELSAVEYAGTVSYSRYNEPLSDDVIFTRIAQARRFLPQARLHTNTNGDYLRADTILKLTEAGLNSLNIQCYLNENEPFSLPLIKDRIASVAARIKLDFDEILNTAERYEVKFRYNAMDIRCYALNFKTMGTNRGDSVDKIAPVKRLAPCFVPFHNLYVDYNGSVMPCCNLRSDNPRHRNFILGNIAGTSLQKIFTSRKLCDMRKMLSGYGPKIPPCSSCNFAVPDCKFKSE